MAVGEVDRGIEVQPHRARLLVRGRAVQRQHLVRVIPEVRPDLGLVIFQARLFKEDEGRALLGVEAVEHGLLVMFARLVRLIGGPGQDIAVDRDVVVYVRRLDELLGGQGAQLGSAAHAEARHGLAPGFQRLVHQTEGMLRFGGGGGGALGNGAAEEALRLRGGAQSRHAHRARRLAGDGHVVRVAAEGRDVVPHPLKRLDLIHEAIVAGAAVGILTGKLLGGEETEHTQAVAEVHHQHAFAGKSLAAVVGVPGLTGLERAAVDIDQNGQLLRFSGGPPEVEIQRVLAHGVAEMIVQGDLIVVKADDLGQGVVDLGIARLHCHGRKMRAGAHTAPGLRVFRRLPPKLPDRGLGVGDAGEDLHRPVRGFHALHLAVAQGDNLSHAAALFHGGAQLRGLADPPQCLADERHHREKGDNTQINMASAQVFLSDHGVGDEQRVDDRPGIQGVFVQLQQRRQHDGQQRKEDPEACRARFRFHRRFSRSLNYACSIFPHRPRFVKYNARIAKDCRFNR